MTFNNILFSGLLIFFSSCNGQEKTTPSGNPIGVTLHPTIIKSFKTIGFAPDYDTTLVSQYIRSIFQDSKGNRWFGTIGEGVVKYDGKTLKYFSTSEGFKCNSVFAINEDKKGNLWLGTDLGVYKFDGKSFRNYSQKEGLIHFDISRKGILVDRLGNIWIGTHSGVYKYDSSQDVKGNPCFSYFSQLPDVNVAGLMEDKNGNIWIATSDKGVFRYDGFKVEQFNTLHGIGENYAGGIAQDSSGNMWFTMTKGICKYDGKSFTTYTPADGLGGTEFWGILIEKSGIIWITARGCTTRFDPSLLHDKVKAFKVYTPLEGFTCCVQSIFQDHSGVVWWGTGQGLYRFNGTRFYKVKKDGPW